MEKYVAIIATILGFIGVSTGAFGAHVLEKKVDEKRLVTWHKGVEYMLWHVPAIYLSAIVMKGAPSGAATAAAWFFIAGCIIFSGSLFILVGTGIKKLGAITPIGGFSFLFGWISLAIASTHYFS